MTIYDWGRWVKIEDWRHQIKNLRSSGWFDRREWEKAGFCRSQASINPRTKWQPVKLEYPQWVDYCPFERFTAPMSEKGGLRPLGAMSFVGSADEQGEYVVEAQSRSPDAAMFKIGSPRKRA